MIECNYMKIDSIDLSHPPGYRWEAPRNEIKQSTVKLLHLVYVSLGQQYAASLQMSISHGLQVCVKGNTFTMHPNFHHEYHVDSPGTAWQW